MEGMVNRPPGFIGLPLNTLDLVCPGTYVKCYGASLSIDHVDHPRIGFNMIQYIYIYIIVYISLFASWPSGPLPLFLE